MNIKTNEFSKAQKVLIAITIFVAAFFISQIVSILVMSLFDVKILDIINSAKEHKFETLGIKIAQLIASCILFILPPIIISKLFKHNILKYLQLNTSPKFYYYIIIAIFMIAAFPLLSIITEWNTSIKFPESIKFFEILLRKLEDSNGQLINLILSGNTICDLIINMIVIALIPAIGEELVFRGLIQKYFIKFLKNPHISIFITAFIFSSIHFSFFGFFPRFILGIFLGYLTWNFKSLYPSIFAHFVNNAFAVYMSFHFPDIEKLEEIENYYPENNYIFISIIIIAFALGTLLFVKLKKRSNKNLSN